MKNNGNDNGNCNRKCQCKCKCDCESRNVEDMTIYVKCIGKSLDQAFRCDLAPGHIISVNVLNENSI